MENIIAKKVGGRPLGAKTKKPTLFQQLETEALANLRSVARARNILNKSLESLSNMQQDNPEICRDSNYIKQTLDCIEGLGKATNDIARAINVLLQARKQHEVVGTTTDNTSKADKLMKELGLEDA